MEKDLKFSLNSVNLRYIYKTVTGKSYLRRFKKMSLSVGNEVVKAKIPIPTTRVSVEEETIKAFAVSMNLKYIPMYSDKLDEKGNKILDAQGATVQIYNGTKTERKTLLEGMGNFAKIIFAQLSTAKTDAKGVKTVSISYTPLATTAPIKTP
jgi:hypothetical protein